MGSSKSKHKSKHASAAETQLLQSLRSLIAPFTTPIEGSPIALRNKANELTGILKELEGLVKSMIKNESTAAEKEQREQIYDAITKSVEAYKVFKLKHQEFFAATDEETVLNWRYQLSFCTLMKETCPSFIKQEYEKCIAGKMRDCPRQAEMNELILSCGEPVDLDVEAAIANCIYSNLRRGIREVLGRNSLGAEL
ncbi:hypothetical protein CC80DRAFT_550666 [Byssothecium circinans]|uniref:Uncharacterized protein n=1 Tax=Byssothecium circinans TaxID=147558 RepID=A0A6A5TZ32_9PLEO|nr:hypothetical protein CC80DRAFT_550666 [Byssothecium circinans]